jgi:hypothetical protein
MEDPIEEVRADDRFVAAMLEDVEDAQYWPLTSGHRGVYLLGLIGEGGPGFVSCFTEDDLLETVPLLPAGDYWIACDRVACGTAWVFSPLEWRIECHGWSAGPGWVIV